MRAMRIQATYLSLLAIVALSISYTYMAFLQHSYFAPDKRAGMWSRSEPGTIQQPLPTAHSQGARTGRNASQSWPVLELGLPADAQVIEGQRGVRMAQHDNQMLNPNEIRFSRKDVPRREVCIDAKLRGRKDYSYGYVVERHTRDVTFEER